jgi:rubrerythrin
MAFKSVDDVLDFAIRKEEESAQMYTGLAAKMEKAYMRGVFEDFAREEKGHKKKLLDIKKGKLLVPAAAKVLDLKIAEYVTDVAPSADLDYQEALILAMKKEKEAFRLYTALANATDDSALRTTLLGLAQEEAKHKLRFEVEYDEQFLSEN